MTAETYDNLKQYVGSKDDFTDDLLNMGYTKGKKEGYNQVLDDIEKYFDNLISKGIWNTSPFIVKEYLESMRK